MEDDAENTGGEGLSVEQAAAAFTKQQAAAGASKGQPAPDDATEGEDEAEDVTAASDEDGEESDGEPDEDGQAEDEDDEEQASDQGRFVAANGKVRLPDGSVSTVADLVAGNLRDRDYRQKTMDLAEKRRAFEEQSSAFQASQQQVNADREYMSRLLESIVPPAPDPGLLDTDPAQYLREEAAYNRYQQHLGYLQQQMAQSRQQAEMQQRRALEQKTNEEWEKLQGALPALKDQAKAKAFFDDVKAAAETAGFSPEEVVQFVPYDHRMALVLRKAAQWDRLQASKGKVQQKVQGRPPVQKGGKRLSPDAARARNANDALNRLRQTGSVDDAAAAYLASSRKGSP